MFLLFEISFRFLRWSSYNVYVRHSKRVKQLETRMNQMVHQGINVFPGDNAAAEQYLATMPSMFTQFEFFFNVSCRCLFFFLRNT